MSPSRATLVLAAVAAALSTATAGPARADTAPTQQDRWAFVDNTNADILRIQSPGGAAPALTSPRTNRALEELVVSRDGHRFAYHQTDNFDLSATTQIAVCKADGSLIRVLAKDTYFYSSFNRDTAPQLSPAGTRLVATNELRGGQPSLVLYEVRTGARTTLAGSSGLTVSAWLTQRWLLASGPAGFVTTSANGGGPHQGVTGLTSDDSSFAVSPDGHQLVWSRLTSGDADTATADLYRGTLTVSDDGVATVSDVTQLVTGMDNVSPTWSRDGLRIDFTRTTGEAFVGKGKRGTVPAAGGTAALYSSVLSATEVVDLFIPGLPR
ncbi:MAG: hypothetical protein JWO22_3193 [Frankiales bacterium]|nr:hypothetical protein [Frankiales bacterium]